MKSAWIGVLVSCSLVSATWSADAAEPSADSAPISTLHLVVSAETLAPLQIEPARLAYLVEVENTGVQVQLVSPASSSAAEWRMFIDPTSAAMQVAITFEHGNLTDSRLIDLQEVDGDARARVVALALTEMLRAVSPPPVREERAPSPAPPPPRSPHPSPRGAPPRARSARWAFEVLGGGSWIPRSGSVLGDVRGAGERLVGRSIWLRGEAGVAVGGAADVAGRVHATWPTLAIGARARSALHPRVEVGVGPTFDLGFVFASASVDGGARGLHAQTSTLRASFELDGRLRLGGRWYATSAISVGAMLRGFELRAEDRVPFAATGLVAGLRLGLGISLP